MLVFMVLRGEITIISLCIVMSLHNTHSKVSEWILYTLDLMSMLLICCSVYIEMYFYSLDVTGGGLSLYCMWFYYHLGAFC